jgi:serine/threonine-protein kinase
LLFPPLPEPENGIIVPRLTGLSVPAAEARLRQLGLRVTESTQIAHPTQPPGLIIAQSPLPGQQLRQLGSVRLAVSAGLPRVPVPNVIGLTAERARSVLAALGFEADERTEEASAAEGTVVRVAPPAGSEQPVPSRVVIFLSSGPPPSPLDTLPVPQDTVPLPHTSE